MPTPESLARQQIDQLLADSGWMVQDRLGMNLYAGRGVAVREFPLGTGFADYLLFMDRKAVGVVEAKKVGTTLSGVAEQAGSYAAGLPKNVPHIGTDKLPFVYESTGVETFFRDERDPQPRSRRVFSFHRPETLAEWCVDDGRGAWHAPGSGHAPSEPGRTPSAPTLRGRLIQMPSAYPLNTSDLWGAQVEAITNLEQSFAQDKPRALIQMATGSAPPFLIRNDYAKWKAPPPARKHPREPKTCY